MMSQMKEDVTEMLVTEGSGVALGDKPRKPYEAQSTFAAGTKLLKSMDDTPLHSLLSN